MLPQPFCFTCVTWNIISNFNVLDFILEKKSEILGNFCLTTIVTLVQCICGPRHFFLKKHIFKNISANGPEKIQNIGHNWFKQFQEWNILKSVAWQYQANYMACTFSQYHVAVLLLGRMYFSNNDKFGALGASLVNKRQPWMFKFFVYLR